MHWATESLLASLKRDKKETEYAESEGTNPVKVLAKAYEVARNALEYRADHLVRRAAIERILKRQLVFSPTYQVLSETLLEELRWARYVADPKFESRLVKEIASVVDKYSPALKSGKFDYDWLVGIMSAEIEELLNPNADYDKFTTFAFNAVKRKVRMEMDNLDLFLFVATERVYAQADNQQISYHLLKLMRSQAEKEKPPETTLLERTRDAFLLSKDNPRVNKLAVFIRKQIGPLVLLRDMYFAKPEEFNNLMENEEEFRKAAGEIMEQQLKKMRKRLNTATVRSLIYVFLTKMLLILVVEIPVERLLGGIGNLLTLMMNLVLPVGIMWILSASIKLPSKKEQEAVKNAAAEVVFRFDQEIPEDQLLTTLDQKGSKVMQGLYYLFYGILFLAIFAGLIALLTKLHFSFISQVIFIFFLCLVTFFAFRIKQNVQVYVYKPRSRGGYSFAENLMLPIVTVGGMLSQGVSRLNFMVFVFDFILESPYKIILHFLDRWFAFLSLKKDEVVG